MIPYIDYHAQSYRIGDIDPAYPMLEYICNRFELNIEQRYWIAFLYGCCYCGPTVFYMYNEFPDFENVDVGRLSRWWKYHKQQCLFQTDRLRIRSNDQFIPAFESYRSLVYPNGTQEALVCNSIPNSTLQHNYNKLYRVLSQTKYFGRYSMFLWLECMYRLTNIPIMPDRLDWKNANNCYNGLMHAFELLETNNVPNGADCVVADGLLSCIINQIKTKYPDYRTDIWNIETTLCAYYKYCHGKRYIGYYLKRQLEEIDKMAASVPNGVCWDVLYDFRKEIIDPLQPKE